MIPEDFSSMSSTQYISMTNQLIYYSRYVPNDTRTSRLSVLREILSVSQKNNARDGITGFLIFDQIWFIQVLEGDEAAVCTTYGRITSDPRHAGSTIIGMSSIKDRSFPIWSMGGSMRSAESKDIYLAHGVGSALDATKLKGSTALSLAIELQTYEQATRSSVRLAG